MLLSRENRSDRKALLRQRQSSRQETTGLFWLSQNGTARWIVGARSNHSCVGEALQNRWQNRGPGRFRDVSLHRIDQLRSVLPQPRTRPRKFVREPLDIAAGYSLHGRSNRSDPSSEARHRRTRHMRVRAASVRLTTPVGTPARATWTRRTLPPHRAVTPPTSARIPPTY